MRDDGLLKVFGFAHPDLERIELPRNTTCLYCSELITEGEGGGFSMMHIDEHSQAARIYEHRACFLRGVFGSLAHIQQRCSCFVRGSTCGDPEGMTLREAAEAAVEEYEKQRHQ